MEARDPVRTGAEQGGYVEIYPSDLWRGFVKFWWLCLLLLLLGGGLMFYKSYVRFTPSYTASATFTVQTQEGNLSGAGLTTYTFYYNRTTASQLSASFPYILQSNVLQERICADLGLSYLPVSLSASSVSGTNMFTLTAAGSNAELTYRVLLSAIENYSSVAEYVIGNTELTMLTPPALPTAPSNSLAYRRQVLLGAVAGLMLGCGWILLYAVCRRTVRTRSDVRKKLNQHCIGVLPQVRFKRYRRQIDRSVLFTNKRVGEGFKESLRALRNSLLHRAGDACPVIMVTSTAPGEGKTTVAINLALALARVGKGVLLIDGDFRNPSVASRLGERGAQAREGEDPLGIQFRRLESCGISLGLFDPRRNWKRIRVEELKARLDALREDYDYIIVDSAPCGLTSDAAVIAAAVDGAILVIRQDTIRIPRIQSAMDSLLSMDVPILGCLLNCASSGAGGYGENYGYRYGGYGKYKGYGRHGYGEA